MKPEQEQLDAPGEDPGEESIEALERAGDIDGLLVLARRYRTGDGVAADLEATFSAYEAAGRLGSGDAHYAIALFHLTGRIPNAESSAGLARLREAADAGHLQARVYLGNLYASGTHYKRDPEKAEVWYRSAARAANVEAEPGSTAYATALAELGCGAWVKRADLVDDSSREALARKAKNLGFREGEISEPLATGGPVSRGPASLPRSTDTTSPVSTPPRSQNTDADSDTDTADAATEERSSPRNVKKQLPSPKVDASPREPRFTPGPGLAAFMYATLFLGAAAGAGYALEQGATYMLQHKTDVPLFGGHIERIGPLALLVFGILPTLIVYKTRTWLRAIPGGILGAGAGWVLWGTGQWQWLPSRIHQTGVFTCAGFLAVLLVFGFAGGARRKPAPNEAKL